MRHRIERKSKETLAALPEPLRERAERLPVIFERQPNAELQADGIEADTLGLFTGAEFAGRERCAAAAADNLVSGKHLGRGGNERETIFVKKCGRLFCTSWGITWGLDENDLIERGVDISLI